MGRHEAGRGASRLFTIAGTALLTLALAGGAAWQLGWLRPPGGGSAGAPAGAGGRKLLFYRNPMNPAITSPVPAKDEMGMDYIPVYADESGRPEREKSPEEQAEDFFAEESGGAGVEGLAPVTLDRKAIGLAGIQTAPARRGTIRRGVRTVGRVVPDETRVRHVHTKVGGWVERLHVNFSGQIVRRGSPLLEIYSPELLATQEELLQALAAERSAAGDAALREGTRTLVAAARRRLELFDVPLPLIEEILRTGRTRRAVTLTAPVSGYVTGKGISEGQQVEPGVELYTITDLERIWVEADLYEYEASAARVGDEAALTFSYRPDLRLTGKVTFVYPVLDPESRTLKVRLEFDNPDLELKPAMFGDVTFTLESSEGVSVPDTAVIDSGTRQVVFVRSSAERFEPRRVRLGIRGEGRVQVLSGVQDGEEVVVKANFLLDSESRLRALIEAGTPQ